jgi:hypothetical protein
MEMRLGLVEGAVSDFGYPRANSVGLKRPKPSAVFLAVEALESLICSRYLMSRHAAPLEVNAKMSRSNSKTLPGDEFFNAPYGHANL